MFRLESSSIAQLYCVKILFEFVNFSWSYSRSKELSLLTSEFFFYEHTVITYNNKGGFTVLVSVYKNSASYPQR